MAGKFLTFGVAALWLVASGLFLPGCPLPPAIDADNPAGLGLQRVVDPTYTPGGTVDVTITLVAAKSDSITAIGLQESIPEGWTYVAAAGISGPAPPITPAAGAVDTLDFAWFTPPSFPYQFRYTLMVPREAVGPVEIRGAVEYREEAGPYVTDAVVSSVAAANPAGVVLERTHAAAYTPGAELAVAIRIEAADGDSIAALGLSEHIPAGWSFVAADGTLAVPDVLPAAGRTEVLEFAFIDIPAFPYEFTYILQVPADATGPAEISGHVAYRQDAGPLMTERLVSTIDSP